jgi:hypothetical protein
LFGVWGSGLLAGWQADVAVAWEHEALRVNEK